MGMEDNKRLKMGTTYGAQPTYKSAQAPQELDQRQRVRRSQRRERKRTQPQQTQPQQGQPVQRPVQNGQYRQAQPPRPRPPMSNGYAMTQQATLAAAAGMMQRPRTAPHRAQPRYTANVTMSNKVSVPNMTSVPMS